MKKDANISLCGKYRYYLERDWSGKENAPYALFIGINPSTADAVTDDATIRKCRGYAEIAGFKRIFMVNLYTYRTKDWKILLSLPEGERIGYETDKILFYLAGNAGMTVAAWGNLYDKDRGCMDRAAYVESELRKIGRIYVLGLTDKGYPIHPSRFRYGMPVLWANTKDF